MANSRILRKTVKFLETIPKVRRLARMSKAAFFGQETRERIDRLENSPALLKHELKIKELIESQGRMQHAMAELVAYNSTLSNLALSAPAAFRHFRKSLGAMDQEIEKVRAFAASHASSKDVLAVISGQIRTISEQLQDAQSNIIGLSKQAEHLTAVQSSNDEQRTVHAEDLARLKATQLAHSDALLRSPKSEDVNKVSSAVDDFRKAFHSDLDHHRSALRSLDASVEALTLGSKAIQSGIEQNSASCSRTLVEMQSEVGVQGATISALKNSTEAEVNRLWKVIKDQYQLMHDDLEMVAHKLEEKTSAKPAEPISTNISTSNADAHLDRRLQDLKQRIEFVRGEVLFELRRNELAKVSKDIPAKVINPEAMPLRKVNLGCGHVPREGYINVDLRELAGVDLVSDIGNLPFHADELQEIYSAHLLEHFTNDDLTHRLLPYWIHLLQNGGVFRAVVPDAGAMIRSCLSGNMEFDDLRLVTFGAQDYNGDFHYNMFTAEYLTGILNAAGLSDVEVVEQGRRNGKCLELEILAYRRLP